MKLCIRVALALLVLCIVIVAGSPINVPIAGQWKGGVLGLIAEVWSRNWPTFSLVIIIVLMVVFDIVLWIRLNR